jgi:nucleoside-diphosphate-sugar epimerase
VAAAVALITGATGLIGRHLLEIWDVDGLEPLPAVGVDLLVPGAADDLVQRVRPSVVVHLAWTASGTANYRDDARNAAWVDASLALAAAAARHQAWFVGTGTAVDEQAVPADAYTAAKVRLRAELAPSIADGACSWLRPYYVVDPTLGRPSLVAAALRARDAGQPLALRTPQSRHDFVHARDVGAAALLVVRHRMPGEVAVGSGEARPVTDLVEALGATWTTTGGERMASPAQVPAQAHSAADVRRLRQHGWNPHWTKEMFHRA